jgi:heavy metal sensor kinase
MIRSLRARLTVWYVAFLSLLLLLFSMLLHHLVAQALERRLDESLSVEANTGAALLADEFQEMKGNASVAASEVLADLRLSGSTVAFTDGARVLGSSAPAAMDELTDIARRAQASGPGHNVVFEPGGGPNGAHAAVVRERLGGQEYVTIAMQPLDEIAADLALLRRVMLLALPLAIGLAAIGGYWLTRRNLLPLASMAQQARQITHSNLETRLDAGEAAEELATLSASFNELLSRLDQSFENMRRFVADASHELRTPIAIIRGEADVALANERSTAEYKEALTLVLDESRRLSRLVDDLLNLARADAGRVKLRVEEFYLNDLLAECCRAAHTLAGARGVTLECTPHDDLAFHGDEELVHRMVLNLVDNAIRYTPQGGHVTVSLDGRAGDVEIHVADTGTGIAADVAPHVFERFYRGDKARARQDGGFGLGLAIVKWIAELHCGSVDVASAPGAGSTFTVKLPRESV